MVTFPTFQVPNLGPPVADYASMISNIGKSFEDTYARTRERTLADQFADATKAYALQQGQQTAPGAVPQPNAAGGYNTGGKLPAFAGGIAGGGTMTTPAAPEVTQAVMKYASQYGFDPKDVLTAMSYETGGTLDPWKKGPTTKWGQHRGLIQMGEPQRQQYGITQDSSVDDQVKASMQYLVDRGAKPGMGLLDIYSTINAGRPGLYGRSDAAAGGAPGTVADKVAGMAGHIARANALLTKWGGTPSTGGAVAATAAPGAGPTPPGAVQAAPAGVAPVAPAGRQVTASGVIPAAGAPDQAAIENAQQILANRLSTPPMVENAKAVLARAGVDPTTTASIPPGAATAPSIAAGPGGGAAMTLPPEAGGPPVPPPAGPAPTTPPPSVAAAPTAAPAAPATAAAPPPQPAPARSPPAASPASQAPPPLPQQAPLGIPAGLLAAMARNPATAAQAAAIIGQRALAENKPQVQEVGGVLYQYAPGRGWVPVAGSAKPEVHEAGGVLYERGADGQLKPIGAGQGYGILGPNDKDARRAKNIPENDTRPYSVAPNGKAEPMTVDPTTFDREQKLRGDFDGQTQNKEFYTVRDQWERLKTGYTDPGGAGDLTIVYSLMKMLDPGTGVREGDFAQAGQVSSLAEKWRGLYNSLIEGTGRLDPGVREQIYEQARRVTVAQGSLFNKRVDQQHKLAKQYSLTPDNVAQHAELPDLKEAVPSGKPLKAQTGAAGAAAVPAPTNAVTGRPAAPGAAAAPSTTPGAPGVPGANQENPMPMPSSAAGDGLPKDTYFRTPDGKVWQSDGTGRR